MFNFVHVPMHRLFINMLNPTGILRTLWAFYKPTVNVYYWMDFNQTYIMSSVWRVVVHGSVCEPVAHLDQAVIPKSNKHFLYMRISSDDRNFMQFTLCILWYLYYRPTLTKTFF
jgi:hypothetical protein